MQPSSENDNWKPLESNPEVMNEYATKIGFIEFIEDRVES